MTATSSKSLDAHTQAYGRRGKTPTLLVKFVTCSYLLLEPTKTHSYYYLVNDKSKNDLAETISHSIHLTSYLALKHNKKAKYNNSAS
ncbi:hypothetical protein GYH30_026375 [Glycine max]|uniref:Uncharacterized protein n=1 Tax=Glycine max TaxID=3847 RepID=A0A0R0IN58_SOYBN|nr:hypothetical protein GYH30_026375 [Glycine max]